MQENELTLGDGRVLHYYDWKPEFEEPELTVFWHHGTPNIGKPPAPLFAAALEMGIRWIGYDRPGYGGSSARSGRDVASCAEDVARIADQLGIEQFAVMGHSGGGPHALACAALLPKRVIAAVSIAGLAPFDAAGLDWFKGMTESGAASLRAAAQGHAAKAYHEAQNQEFDREMFTPEDWAELSGTWSWFDSVVRPALSEGPGGLIDDDLAYVAPWGFDCARIVQPVLLVHGAQDRVVPCAHSEWLARTCRSARLWQRPDDGHISVLNSAASALAWLREQASDG
jgi:pimeloyl-ACP methyl ester carboxylesterase